MFDELGNVDEKLYANSDVFSMNYLSRLYVRDNNMDALKVAAMNLATCSDDKESSMVFWWNEGVRDYAMNENHIKELNNDLIVARDEIANS